MKELEEEVETVEDPEVQKTPCVLLLDTSSSMQGEKIQQLNDGLRFFKEDVNENEKARKRVEVAVVEFDSNVEVVNDFQQATEFEPMELTASGTTAMGEGLLEAMDLVDQRKDVYNQRGVDYLRPWIFLITDGKPKDMDPPEKTDDSGMVDKWNRVTTRLEDGEEGKHFAFWPVGVDEADMDILENLSQERKPKKLQRGKFEEMFEWLSNSMQRMSESEEGEEVNLGPTEEWGQVKA
jgi:uncharacterized protein YegL